MEGKLDPRWRKSSFSGNGGGSCVEVGNADEVLVRDTTQHGTGPVLSFTPEAWTEFTSALKDLAARL